MKNKTISIVAIMSLLLIIILLLFNQRSLSTNVCCNEHPFCNSDNCSITDLPRIDNENGQIFADDVQLYYKIDNNCDFQTLVFDPYKDESIEKNSYTIVGRFTGEHLSDNQYKIKKLETKVYLLDTLDTSRQYTYKIENVTFDKGNSDERDIKFKVFVKNIAKDQFKADSIDNIYGNRRNENPIILNNDADISFEVEIQNPRRRKTSGGYECNGRAITGGG